MRHGYGTHRQRIVLNLGAVAEEMGNSVVICRRHYVNAFCGDAEANEWFSIVPENPANVISLSDAQRAVEHLDEAINIKT